MEEIACFKNIQKSYDKPILSIDELHLMSGECLIIKGKNGSGKSTLLKIMAGVMSADMGEIYYQNSVFPAKKRHLLTADSIYLASKAYLFNCNIERNIIYPLRLKKSKKNQDNIEKALHWANLTHLRGKHPNNLSSGEIQRVAIVRAKIINPRIWLLDEPTENLDQDIKQKFYQLLNQLLEKGHSIVIATHAEEIAHNVTNKTLQLTHQKLST
ncbi:hypothetical protein BPUTSESOX_1888 [uncultured Gammaproteobacteria bacterium]|nr:hypothetical protein [uncultured Gammaproteobacteria bacterium]CAC9570348.1 hypothetical protein [uncultured Gammaproteobacteria bacterium]VVH52514.1 hypothetical protein BPUTSESOX_1888 [uncultured Gammaproteobacteria bacterium]